MHMLRKQSVKLLRGRAIDWLIGEIGADARDETLREDAAERSERKTSREVGKREVGDDQAYLLILGSRVIDLDAQEVEEVSDYSNGVAWG